MARTVTLPAMKSALAQSTNKVWIVMLEISHPSISTIYRCNDTANITSTLAGGSHDFIASPFSITLPTDESEQEPQVKLTMPNVTRDFITQVRSITGGPTIRIWIVLSDTPNSAEYGPVRVKATSVTYNAETLQFVLGVDFYTGEPIPWLKFTPEYFPSMFR